jgi:two-component system, OmpR family, response regulator QseB
MRILLVEDDDRIAKPLAEALRHQNHGIEIARDGIEGWDYATAAQYELILLDLMLPRMDGITLCKRLRADGSQALILMLTAKDTTTDKVVGLDAGADDYLVKPFKLEELAARIRALSRRRGDTKPQILSYGKLQLDSGTYMTTYAGYPLTLTPKEYRILECFLRSPTQVFSRAALLDKLWDLDQLSGEETIKTHIANLRRKFKAVGCLEEAIETIYGIGYRLNNAPP